VQLTEKLGLGGNVVFAGTRSDVDRLLPLLDVFALASRTECFPMALLEAMAVGRPAVCTDVGGVSEILEDAVTGYTVPPRDPAALADRLLELLTDPARAELMGNAGRRRLEAEFTLDRSVRNAEAAFEETAGRRAPGGTRGPLP
jgi:glycosyltransferase involved in cell wall biosynthesis